MAKVESFKLNHNAVKAPYMRVAGVEHDDNGSTIKKIDLRFLQPNQESFPTAALHTLEHLLATYMRDYLPGIIDISPMDCRTGFYCIKWEESTPEEITSALEKILQQVLETEVVPTVTAKEYVRSVLEKGNSRDPFERILGNQTTSV